MKKLPLFIMFLLSLTTLVGCVGGNCNVSSNQLMPVFSSFSIDGHTGAIGENTISVTLPYGSSESGLIATFSTTESTATTIAKLATINSNLSTISGMMVTVNGVVQISGVTVNNFTAPVTYVIKANGKTQLYTVTVDIAASESNSITSFSIGGQLSSSINGNNIAVVMPYATNPSGLVAEFVTTGESVAINGVLQTSGVIANNFTDPVIYTVTAANGETQNYNVTVVNSPTETCESRAVGDVYTLTESSVVVNYVVVDNNTIGAEIANLDATHNICTTHVTNMSGLFENVNSNVNLCATSVGVSGVDSANLNNWDTSNVIDMSYMFHCTASFNQPLNNWNTSNVTNMQSMFNQAASFNQPLDSWNTGSVNDMSYMFSIATKFNQPLNNWNTSNVTNMQSMFNQATSFNQPINNWNTAKVTNMSFMFQGATNFGADPAINLSGWNVGAVTDYTCFNVNAYSAWVESSTRQPQWISGALLGC